MSTKYNRYALAVLTIGVLGCAAAWRLANVMYRGGSQLEGWWVGLLGCALPALALGAYALWLRHQRALGQPGAQVPWLNAAIGLAVAFSVFLLLFSLM